MEETVEAVEAPWGRRYERELRDIYENESLGPVGEISTARREGQRSWSPAVRGPGPLPPIQEDEVKLICWMVVSPEEGNEEDDRPETYEPSDIQLTGFPELLIDVL